MIYVHTKISSTTPSSTTSSHKTLCKNMPSAKMWPPTNLGSIICRWPASSSAIDPDARVDPQVPMEEADDLLQRRDEADRQSGRRRKMDMPHHLVVLGHLVVQSPPHLVQVNCVIIIHECDHVAAGARAKLSLQDLAPFVVVPGGVVDPPLLPVLVLLPLPELVHKFGEVVDRLQRVVLGNQIDRPEPVVRHDEYRSGAELAGGERRGAVWCVLLVLHLREPSPQPSIQCLHIRPLRADPLVEAAVPFRELPLQLQRGQCGGGGLAHGPRLEQVEPAVPYGR